MLAPRGIDPGIQGVLLRLFWARSVWPNRQPSSLATLASYHKLASHHKTRRHAQPTVEVLRRDGEPGVDVLFAVQWRAGWRLSVLAGSCRFTFRAVFGGLIISYDIG